MKAFRVFVGMISIGSVLVLGGCQHTHEEVQLSASASKPTLDSSKTVYVPLPPPAKNKNDIIPNSNTATANALREAFAKYVKRAYVGRRIETREQALETARKTGCSYVVLPSILIWEDRATEFSGIRDKLEVKVEVIAADTGEVLDATVLKSKSRWMTDGGDAPQHLLPEPADNYAGSLFQQIEMPSALRK